MIFINMMHHCQLRNEASNLNYHLYLHHLNDNPNCPHCRNCNEDNCRFFLNCPSYKEYRWSLQKLCNDMNIDYNLNYILFGNATLSYVDNVKLQLSVPKYIKE